MKSRVIALLTVPLTAFALAACTVEEEQEGEMPDVEVQEGEMPEVDVESNIDVETDTAQVEVPEIEYEENDTL